MNGHVDNDGRALLTLAIRPSEEAVPSEIVAWIDTGFNGDLVLPQQRIDDLALPQSGTVMGILADWSEIVLDQYQCWIDWFGEQFDLRSFPTRANFRFSASGCWRITTFTLAIGQAKLASCNRARA